MSSTSVLSSVSNATINIFDTVSNTATAATKLVNGVGTGANMFERMMNDMDANHRKRSLINQNGYEKELLETAAAEVSKRQASIRKAMAEDPDFKELFYENYKELELLLNPAKTEG